MAGVLAYRFYSEFRDNKRRDLEITVRARTEKALQELADPNNNGLSWVAKPLKPKSPDERIALQNIMTELSGTLADEDRWRLSELYEAIGLQTDDMRFVRSGNGQWYDRARAAHRLGRMRCASASEALISALRDPSENVRLMAIWALAEIGDDRSVSSIVDSLADADGWELIQAASCLLGMSADFTLPLLDLLRGSGAKRERRERIASTVLNLLGEFGLHARDRLNARACRQAVAELIKSDSVDIRARSVRALAALGVESSEDFEIIMRSLRDSAWEVRAVTAKALGQMQLLESIPYLCQAVSDEAFQVRHNAANALGQLGEFGFDALTQLQHSEDRFAREMAQEVLEQYQTA